MRDTIAVYAPGHWDYCDSYGLIACQLARHLTRLGIRVSPGAIGQTAVDNQPPDIRAVTEQPLRATLGGIFLGYPDGYAKHDNPLTRFGPRVAITMFESSRIPTSWIAPLNRCDAVIVPSEFCATVFQGAGVTAKIYVVPLGVAESYVYRPRVALEGRPLTFLAFLDRGMRKGGIIAMQAFLRAFGDSRDVHLILKARTAKTPLRFTNDNIEVIQHDMDEAELYDLYCRADILINPHKGEGFGLIPREFAATGGLALTTNWSGTVDDLDLWGLPLPYTLEPASWRGSVNLAGQDLGQWAYVDPKAVAKILVQVADRWPDYARTAPARAAWATLLYSWPSFASRVLEIWREVAYVGQPALHASPV